MHQIASICVVFIASYYITQNVQLESLANQIPIASDWLYPVIKHAGAYFAATAKIGYHCYPDRIFSAGDCTAGLRQQLADASDIASSSAPESAMDSSPCPGISSSMLPVLSLQVTVQQC